MLGEILASYFLSPVKQLLNTTIAMEVNKIDGMRAGAAQEDDKPVSKSFTQDDSEQMAFD